KNGYIKQVILAYLQHTITYKSRAITTIKLKSNESKVVLIDQVQPDSKEEITLITNQAYAVRFDISEIPTSGSKAVGVKSVNLKDDDYIVNYVLADPKYIDLIKVGIITQRGDFKQLKLNLIDRKST